MVGVNLEQIQHKIEVLSERRAERISHGGDPGNLTTELRNLYEVKRTEIARIEQAARSPVLLGAHSWRLIPGVWETALKHAARGTNGNR